MEYQEPNNYQHMRRSQVFFDYNNRATLGCGTIILLILIVLFFGNLGTRDIRALQRDVENLEERISGLQTSFSTQQAMLQSQNQRIDELNKKIDRLEEQITKLQNSLE